jgi:Nucleotidyl transferase AbiEii toxin, Type IV TA system
MRKPLKNVGASVRARLLNLSQERGEPFELSLTQYALERLLYRLSVSAYKDKFVLKGAMLLRHLLDDPHRPTRDNALARSLAGTFTFNANTSKIAL